MYHYVKSGSTKAISQNRELTLTQVVLTNTTCYVYIVAVIT